MKGQKTILVLGGGIGGVVAANLLRKKIPRLTNIILIDKNVQHIFAPSFLWLMLEKRQAAKIQKPLTKLERKGIKFVNDQIVQILPEKNLVKTKKQSFPYDYLVISLGAELVPAKIPGLSTAGFNLYELASVEKLQRELKNFSGGKVTIVISSLPFKCPAAPYEAAFLFDEYFQKNNLKDKTAINIFTPEILPMPIAGEEVGKAVVSLLEAKNIKFNPNYQLTSVNPSEKELKFANNQTFNFNLLIFTPPHQGTAVVKKSGLGNEAGWIPVDSDTLKTRYANIWAIGDANIILLPSGKPLPKAGVFAHLQAEVVCESIVNEILGHGAQKKFTGTGYCFLETGFGKAAFASGNFYSNPVDVKLKPPSRFWHLGKILFEKYWFWRWF